MSQETQIPQSDTVDKYLPEGSEVFSTINEDGLDIHLVRSPGYNDGDQALLVVHTKMRPCAYLAGNPLQLEVKQGQGRLQTVNLATSEIISTDLQPGWTGEVHPGVVYWYENAEDASQQDLVVLDTCVDFNPDHEPALEDVVKRFTSLLSQG